MKKVEIVTNVSRAVRKAGFQIKKHSPEILVFVGVVGTVASAVMACKATTKVSAILEETKEQIDGIHDVLENEELGKKYEEKYGEKFTVEESKKELAIVYAHTGVKLVKLYAPSVIFGIASLSCIITSNNIMRKRNVALAAAYATVDKGFKEYRGRVVERFGQELDRELKYNIRAKEVEERVVDEDGNEKIVTKTVQVANPTHNGYTQLFDEHCAGHTKDPEYNKYFLLQQQNYANEKLQADGHLFLNDVYAMLGMDKTKAGHAVGWVYDPTNPDLHNFVDFGIFDMYDERKVAFTKGWERSIWLDFNVDGPILNMIGYKDM